jgi:tetratricopeptide (TPR) repeat protein
MTTRQAKYLQMAADGAVDAALSACGADIRMFERGNEMDLAADALHARAMILDWYLSQYEECVVSLHREIEIREAHNLDGLDAAYLRLGIVQMFLGQDDVVLAHMKQVLDLGPNNKTRGTALNVIGDTVFKTKPEQAEQCFIESEALLREANDDYNLAHVRLSSARLQGWRGNYDNALEICRVEMDKAKQIDSQGIIGTAYLRVAEVYSDQERTELAREYAQEAYEIGLKNNWKILCDEAMALMS